VRDLLSALASVLAACSGKKSNSPSSSPDARPGRKTALMPSADFRSPPHGAPSRCLDNRLVLRSAPALPGQPGSCGLIAMR
jgi:hypothetical protein